MSHSIVTFFCDIVTFVKNINNQYEVSIFDFDSLDIESFINKEFTLKVVGIENRVEIFIKLSEKVSIEISSGRNALNRGIWLKGIKRTSDLKIVSDLDYIKVLFQTKINLNFDKNIFMMERAKKTLEIIKQY